MPTYNQENTSGDTTEKPINITEDNPKKQRRRGGAIKTHRREDKNTIVEIASIPKIEEKEAIEANRIAREANFIAWRSIAVNAFLAFVTVILAGAAIIQYKSSQSAAEIAQETFTETKKFDNITLVNQKADSKKADDSAKSKYKRDTATFGIQKRSLDAQVKSLQETEKRYLDETTPFIEVRKFSNFNLRGLDGALFKFDIVSYGTATVRIIDGTEKFIFIENDDTSKFLKDPFKWKKPQYTNNPMYVTKDSPQTISFILDRVLDSSEVKKFLDGGSQAYFYGTMNYINSVNKRMRQYVFVVQLVPPQPTLAMTYSIVKFSENYKEPVKK